MPNHNAPPSRPSTLFALCLVLWLVSALLAVYGLWLFPQPGSTVQAVLALVVALLSLLAGWGLYRLRRWGVVLFALLGFAGSINHIANAVQRFVRLNTGETSAAVSSVIGVLGAFLIPFALIYLVIVLWRQAR